MLDQINEVFFEEANELLESLEGYLLSLEENPTDKEIISAVFRIMHTIKGSSGMFGFDAISSFTHEVESAFDTVRNGTAPVTPELIKLTLQSRDHILDMLGGTISDETSTRLIEEFKQLMTPYKNGTAPALAAEPSQNADSTPTVASEGKAIPVMKTTISSSKAEKNSAPQATWRISFTPSPSILCNGTRPSLMIKELTEMGDATVILFTKNIPPLSQIEPTTCYLAWDVILTTDQSQQDIQDVFIFLDETSVIKIDSIDVGDEVTHKIGEILINRKHISQETLEEILSERKPIGQMLVEKNIITSESLHSALAEQEHIKTVSKPKEAAQSNTPQTTAQQSIRVSSDKLDQLIDLVGELVTFNARLGQHAQMANNPTLLMLSEQSERLIIALRNNAMDMRMLPIGTIFTRFRRLVHDLSADMHKNIELVTEGAETELDKTVIEKLNDPLIHMIRNSVDHGIETREERIAKGKNPQGTVKLIAQHAGAFVLIIISDDGAGLNKEKIYKKAIDKGLVAPGADVSDNDIYNMIFLPGFSTADKVSSVSGRGVGMDVVKKDITALNGTVSIESRPGEGTDFILKIPLTLAIIEGMLVQIGASTFVIPLSNIQECMEFKPEHGDDGKVCSHITARGEFLPYINLREWFEIDDPMPTSQQVVIVNDQDSSLGLVVDKVIGNNQTVIKPLGDLYKNAEGLSGATVLGDGSVALILDVFKLSNVVKRTEATV
ncbi:MAG: chemotaxis protein CheA [Spirochaetaceae bacterium]|nr:chemotaxis protein CheA [Spirochaetaceae bacterium]MBQ8385002.1 chemotaxis protein CheA [Spirochaetaceae bacterium]MBR2361731.1 chemotaxis protein CheA [Spirochaetaceae bacterium]